MLFSSTEFLLAFLPIVLGIFTWINRRSDGRNAVGFLAAASIAFYAWWDWRYVGLLAFSIAWNWVIGSKVAQSRSRPLLALGVTGNLAALGYYKYANFFVNVANDIAGTNVQLEQIILPLGISFFTFTQIAFLVDSYRGEVKEKSVLSYVLFVTFFPHLIAGPVLHHGQMMPQFERMQGRKPSSLMVANGLFLLVMGLFKKLIIADNLARYVDPAFANVAMLQILDAWTAAIGYSLQLYFDFSAYSEMACGIAMLFGITMPLNFNSPYKATSISDFWKRWHMTLSRFLRDYLYIPLGGNRNGEFRMYVALWATMVLGGIWHGAGWQFVLWGVLHGTMLILHRAWLKTGIAVPAWPARIATYVMVMFAWVAFRANSVQDAMGIWRRMLGLDGVVLPAVFNKLNIDGLQTAMSPMINGIELLIMIPMVIFCMTNRNVVEAWVEWSARPSFKKAILLSAMSVLCFFCINRTSSFIYFNF